MFGDFFQTDLKGANERNGLHDFVRILDNMESFNVTEFNIGDIVRSGFVREYLIEKNKVRIWSRPMNNYDRCLRIILHHEGGYVNHPKDLDR